MTEILVAIMFFIVGYALGCERTERKFIEKFEKRYLGEE